MKMFGTLFFIVTMFFIGFVVLASTPVGRINRACMPVDWAGKAVSTTAGIFKSEWKAPTRAGMKKGHDACRFFIFEQFYAEELERQKAAARDERSHQGT